jgi:hypothetical protein
VTSNQLQFDTNTDQATPESARNHAISQVENNARTDWLNAAAETVITLATRHHEFTTDDMWDALQHIDAPHEPRAMGAVMVQAARRKIIIKTDRVQNSRRIECHARPIAIWQSLLTQPTTTQEFLATLT